MRTAGLRLDKGPSLDVPLRYFLTAPLFGVAAGLLLAWRGAALLQTPWHPHTIALAHLVTLGVVTMVMLGALHQILPVVVGADVPGARWSRLLHPLFSLGVLGLAGGLLLGRPWLLLAALLLLAASLLPLLGQVALGLLRGAGHSPTVQLLRLALLAFAGSLALGLLFGLGHALGHWPLPRAAALPLHVFWSLGGWVGALIAGVGMTVLPMFYLAPPFARGATRAVLAALAAMLVTAPAVLFATAGRAWLLLPLACGAVALAVFSAEVWRLLRARRRKLSDVSLRYWQGGLAGAWLALALATAAVLSPDPRWGLAFGVVYLTGFAGAVLGGMLTRIVPFLVWMRRFSHVAGKTTVPLMRDLLPPRHAAWQQVCHGAAVLLLAAAALTGADELTRVAGFAFALANGYLWANLWHAARFRPAAAPGPGPASGSREPEPPAGDPRRRRPARGRESVLG